MAPHSIHPVFTQSFSLTYTMMSYIHAQRISAINHSKMIQSCKEFMMNLLLSKMTIFM